MSLYCAIALPVRLPLLNEQLQNRWGRRSGAARKALAWQVKKALHDNHAWAPPVPFERARITVVRWSTTEPDEDNLNACVKPLLDILQPLSWRHPCGLGIIANDDKKSVIVTAAHCKGAPGFAQTDITIEDLTNGPA